MKNNTLKTNLPNGYFISTVKIGKDWETMVFDNTGDAIDEAHTNYKTDAKHNHMIMVSHYMAA